MELDRITGRIVFSLFDKFAFFSKILNDTLDLFNFGYVSIKFPWACQLDIILAIKKHKLIAVSVIFKSGCHWELRFDITAVLKAQSTRNYGFIKCCNGKEIP